MIGRRYLPLCILYACFVLIAVSCTGDTSGTGKAIPDELISLCDRWNRYNETGRPDSVISTAMPYFYRSLAENDTMGVQFSGSMMLNAYVLSDTYGDTTERFLRLLAPYMESSTDYGVTPTYYSLMGHIALKYGLDYPQAFSSYMKAYRYAEDKGDADNQIVMLYNIVNIFYTRLDRHGLRYAEEALRLSESMNVSTFNKTAANIAMAQALYLDSLPDKAWPYLWKAHETAAKAGQMTYWAPLIDLLYGDIFTMQEDFNRAGKCYELALSHSDISEPSLISQIYLNYGKACELSGDKEKAASLYEQGLRISQSSGSLEFRKELLEHTSTVLFDLGRKDEAAENYRKLQAFIDSSYLENKEHALNNVMIQISDAEHELNTAQHNLSLFKMKRRYYTTLMLLVTTALLAGAAAFLYFRQKRINRETVQRHMGYNKRLMQENGKASGQNQSASQDETYSRLYSEMEKLMKEGAYRDKDLSLETMTRALASNRTYVSNAINRMAGVSFYDYVNTYRINEAVRILSDPVLSAGVNIKQLAADVGFSSLPIFYKIFKRETGVPPGVYKNEAVKLSKS